MRSTITYRPTTRFRWPPPFERPPETAPGAPPERLLTPALHRCTLRIKMEKIPQDLDAEKGQILVKLARSTLMEKLGRRLQASEADRLSSALKDPSFQVPCATFVTLTIKGQLRGCIGTLSSTDPLAESVRRNAFHAAFQDPRFAPLTEEELDRVHIEVSILTEPQPLPYSNAEDLVQKLHPQRDGVIIRQGFASATFLPQVWDQLPKTESFLDHLCLKAGLPRNAWKRSKLDLAIYHVQCFNEPT
jgi:AmmeMemoRadiSam system protein A